MSCEDKVRDKISTTTTESDMAKFREEVVACAVRCADEQVKLIPGLTKKMLDHMNKNKFWCLVVSKWKDSGLGRLSVCMHFKHFCFLLI